MNQYWKKLNEIAEKEKYFAADTAKNMLSNVQLLYKLSHTFSLFSSSLINVNFIPLVVPLDVFL
ncbi:MAG: hypothetical protein QXP77_00340 [Candidatus Aenigmatarchaeota archaeon]